MPTIQSTFNPTSRVLATRLGGQVTPADVSAWVEGLHAALADVPTGGTFKLLFDLTDYEPAGLDAHVAMRTVIPRLLADHGLRPAYIDLFDDDSEMEIASRPRVRCTALANVHHNETGMEDYQHRAGKPEQRFLSDRTEAARWIQEVPF